MPKPCHLQHDWYPSPLPANVSIGDRSWLYSSFAFLHYQSQRQCGVQIGSDTGIYHRTFFELGPQGEVVIGNFCTVVGAIIACNSRIEIGDYALISHDVVIADCAFAHPLPAAVADRGCGTLKTTVRVGVNSWIGARAILLAGADIGEGAIVGAGSVIDFAVPAFAVAAGNPARIVRDSRSKTSAS